MIKIFLVPYAGARRADNKLIARVHHNFLKTRYSIRCRIMCLQRSRICYRLISLSLTITRSTKFLKHLSSLVPLTVLTFYPFSALVDSDPQTSGGKRRTQSVRWSSCKELIYILWSQVVSCTTVIPYMSGIWHHLLEATCSFASICPQMWAWPLILRWRGKRRDGLY